MTNVDPYMREEWLTRALCRRYAAVSFTMTPTQPMRNQSDKGRASYRAFGSLTKGEVRDLGRVEACPSRRPCLSRMAQPADHGSLPGDEHPSVVLF